MISLGQAKRLAIQLAYKAGSVILKNEKKISVVKHKALRNFCTNVDLCVERLIVKGIRKKYPEHNIIAEEETSINKKSDYTWIVDPIDGTKYFIKNVPLFTVCIALKYKDEVVMGVVYNPSTHHLYHAAKGAGAYLNNIKIEVSQIGSIKHAIAALDMQQISRLKKPEIKKALKRLCSFALNTYRIRALGSGSLGLCYLAQGAYDIYFDLTGTAKLVDIAAGTIIVKEAGGFIYNFDKYKGNIHGNAHNRHLLATNSRLRKKIVRLLAE